MSTFALIPAAGQSSRMGRPKLSLPLGTRTVLEWVIDALGRAGVDHILVVAGPHVPELKNLGEKAGAAVLLLPEPTVEMRATIDHGLRWLEERFHPQATDAWLLVPADHPTLEPVVIRQLLKARGDSGKKICLPSYQGRRGHPALISWELVPHIHALPEGTGLNHLFRQLQEDTLEVPVDLPEILRDLDTPEEYEALRKNWKDPLGGSPAE